MDAAISQAARMPPIRHIRERLRLLKSSRSMHSGSSEKHRNPHATSSGRRAPTFPSECQPQAKAVGLKAFEYGGIKRQQQRSEDLRRKVEPAAVTDILSDQHQIDLCSLETIQRLDDAFLLPVEPGGKALGISRQFGEKGARIVTGGQTLKRAVDDQGAVETSTVGQCRELPTAHAFRAIRPAEKTDIRAQRLGKADQTQGALRETLRLQDLWLDPDFAPQQTRNGRIVKETPQFPSLHARFPFS